MKNKLNEYYIEELKAQIKNGQVKEVLITYWGKPVSEDYDVKYAYMYESPPPDEYDELN